MQNRLTAEQYASERFELPDGGRFSELIAGEVITYQPLDTIHGDVVFNLTKQLGTYLHQAEQGYACYELGLVTSRNPDTIRYPAVSVFIDGERFEYSNSEQTVVSPALVIEVDSTSDRHQVMETRIAEYIQFGVQLLWVINPHDQTLTTYNQQGMMLQLEKECEVTAQPILPKFTIAVSTLFRQPTWIR